MAHQVFYSRHSDGVTIYLDGKPLTVSSSQEKFQEILQSLKDKNYEKVKSLIDITGTINKVGVSKKFKDRRVFVENGKVCYIDSHKKKRELAGPLVQRILDDLSKPGAEKYADALLMFCDNVMKNTVKDIREELWEFLASGKTPITMDGCFLSYKKVRSNFKDIYTGQMDNSPGKLVRIPVKDVDKDRNRTCASGLHFCSREYLNSYSTVSGNVVVVVKVNPKHVCAIPTDYQFQKGRASEYYVVGQIDSRWSNETDVFKDSFIDEDTKQTTAPEVIFKAPLKASLATVADSYGLLDKSGKVQIILKDEAYVPVAIVKNKVVDIFGEPINGFSKSDVTLMSIDTKSVRAAVKAEIQKVEKS